MSVVDNLISHSSSSIPSLFHYFSCPHLFYEKNNPNYHMPVVHSLESQRLFWSTEIKTACYLLGSQYWQVFWHGLKKTT